ncbi:MAG: acetyl-CoA carboxylase carboxyltransferase subunit alpha [Candidatus Krumholzibacteriota bacterium]|nr:acetyl-CoA carboxylase carboxyltransferase subunit alpha [Candidatus Krumholzibacteriota bacterium]
MNEQGNTSTGQRHALEFEKPILELEDKIAELRDLASGQNVPVDDEVRRLSDKADHLRNEIYSNLSAWQHVQLARHADRPYALDYIGYMSDEFIEFHGDRGFADDPAIVGGLMTLRDKRVMVIGHQKGRNTRENIHRNFGMPHPEGYRKALRLMKLAEKFRLPVVTLIDTPGAYPGVGAEERGQSQAIADNLKAMAGLEVPLVSVVIGEGGSGGALALGVTDRILMLEYSIYSVISPEGCAAILWKDQDKVKDAAAALKLTSGHLKKLCIVDRVLEEPPGGAHRDPAAMAEELARVLYEELDYLSHFDPASLQEKRREKYLAMGFFHEEST